MASGDKTPGRCTHSRQSVRVAIGPGRWGPRGERLVGFAPGGRWRTLTFLAALRTNALTEPCVFDGPINGALFRACIEQFLTPRLRPGDIVILDNLGSHRSKTVCALILDASQ